MINSTNLENEAEFTFDEGGAFHKATQVGKYWFFVDAVGNNFSATGAAGHLDAYIVWDPRGSSSLPKDSPIRPFGIDAMRGGETNWDGDIWVDGRLYDTNTYTYKSAIPYYVVANEYVHEYLYKNNNATGGTHNTKSSYGYNTELSLYDGKGLADLDKKSNSDWLTFPKTGIDAREAVFRRANALNEYTGDDPPEAATTWVVTIPTRTHYVPQIIYDSCPPAVEGRCALAGGRKEIYDRVPVIGTVDATTAWRAARKLAIGLTVDEQAGCGSAPSYKGAHSASPDGHILGDHVGEAGHYIRCWERFPGSSGLGRAPVRVLRKPNLSGGEEAGLWTRIWRGLVYGWELTWGADCWACGDLARDDDCWGCGSK